MKEYHFEDKNRIILESLNVPFAIYQYIDNRVVTLLVSDGFCSLLHLSREEVCLLMNSDMFRGTHPDDRQRVSNQANSFARDGGVYDVVYRVWSVFHDEYRIIHAQGRRFVTRDGTALSVVQYMDESIHSDLARIRSGDLYSNLPPELESEFGEIRLRDLRVKENYYDHLTGLPNIGYFLKLAESLRSMIKERGGVPAIVAFDLTGMKQFNGKYGLEEGDKLMMAFADLLRHYFGNEDCARFGEDHFAVCTDSRDIEGVIGSIFEDMKHVNGGKSLPVRAGIYLDTFGQVEISVCCDRAKIACDVDRTALRSRFIYYDQKMMLEDINRTYVLNNFNRALKEKWIRAFYQPIVRGFSGKICNEEALARWIDPERGVIMPGEFIPVLEDAKVIYKLDLYMADRILEDFARKKEAGIPLVPVSLNLSRYDFQYCDIVSEIDVRVRQAGLDPSLLIIELTESVTGQDRDYIRKQMRRLHRAGFKIWMDDFGSGYSSLNVLQDFDFDLIKMDMKFMSGFDKSRKNSVILTKIIEMAMELGVDTLVEGVETPEQYRFLKTVGCDKLQGYQFAKATSVSRIIEFNWGKFGLDYESAEEASYSEKIGRASLDEPLSRVSYGLGRYYEGTGVAILECGGFGHIRLLRCNSIYHSMITRIYDIDLYDGTMRIKVDNDNAITRGIGSAIAKCVHLDEWVSTGNISIEKAHLVVNVNVRRIEKNPVNDAYSVILVMSAARFDGNERAEGEASKGAPEVFKLVDSEYPDRPDFYKDLPVAYAVAQLIRDEDGQPVDLKILFVNEQFCKMAGISRNTLEGSFYSSVMNKHEVNWPALAHEVLSAGRSMTDIRYKRMDDRSLSFTISPSSIPDCCAFTFVNCM